MGWRSMSLQFDYNDGMGITYGRFKIDLYSVGGSGDCGTWVTSICDKPTIGCKDSSEFARDKAYFLEHALSVARNGASVDL